MSLTKKNLEEYLQFARKLGHIAREYIKEHRHLSLNVASKDDSTPVTDLDCLVEQVLRYEIEQAYPSHGILGEELGRTSSNTEFQWTLDPIDGTKNFIAGLPGFGTLIGLRYQDSPIVGVVNHPVLEREYYGAKSFGCFCGDRLLSCAETSSRVVFASCRAQFEKVGYASFFYDLVEAFPSLQIHNDPFSQTQAIEGNSAATVEFGLKLWDRTPVELLVTEAGGVYKCLAETKHKEVTLYSSVFGNAKMVQRISEMFNSNKDRLTT